MRAPGYLVQSDDDGNPYIDTSETAVPVQWRLYERHINQLTLRVTDIIDDARILHHSFTDIQLGDGAALRWLNNRQRTLLSQYRDGLKGVASVTVRTLAPRSMPATGRRVGLTPAGTPYEITEDGEDGYAVYLSPGDVPYVDAATVPIADDPITDGWPLPVEVISVTAMKAEWTDGKKLPVTVTTENERSVSKPGRWLHAFASGNRIAPLTRPGQPAASDEWNNVVAVELSFIPLSRLTAICCAVAMPTVLGEALIAAMAEMFARQSRDCTPQERQDFSVAAKVAESRLSNLTSDILGESSTRMVTFKG